MEKKFEDKNDMEKEIILDSMNNVYQYIKLTNEDTLYFNLFNEYLFENHNEWLDNIKNQIKKGIDNNSDSNIKISDINYDNKIINLIKKIVEPHEYKNYKKNNENIYNDEILEKIDELTNFNDIVGTINNCSQSKRKSLLSTIHKKRKNEQENHINYDNDEDSFQDNNEIDNNDNDFNDEDINIKDIIQNDQKEKIINNNIESEEEDSNSLCTITEQPSIEDLEKNNSLSKKSYNLFSNKLNSQLNSQNKINKNNYILDLNNNNNNNYILFNKFEPNSDNKINYKPLKIIESITTPEKNNNYPLSQSINNNNYLLSNTNSKLNQDNLFNSQQKSPYFADIKNEGSSSNKNNINVNNIGMINNGSQFSFNNSNKNISNFNNEFTFSTIKKFDNNLSNNKNYNSSNNKNNAIIIHTSKKNEQDNKNLSNFKNNNDSNNKNFINILTNSINNINNKNIENNNQNNNIEINNNYNNNNQNNLNNNKIIHNNNNYSQNILLNSIKKNNDNLININSNVKIKDKYENDFEEYEMSDSSNKEGDDDEEYGKFIPKWAMDREYINQQIKKQNNNKELIFKSFGNFVVENLNLNMIFETHNENFDIRNSTADWRGDDSFARNKIINIDDKEIDDMFPNRKLQF